MKMLTVISFNAMTMIVRTAFVLYVIACAGATSNNVAVKSINHTVSTTKYYNVSLRFHTTPKGITVVYMYVS